MPKYRASPGTPWIVPDDWRPHTGGEPGPGRVRVTGPDGREYTRPIVIASPPTPQTEAGTVAESGRQPRLTVSRIADAVRLHLQIRERFLSVMELAELPWPAVEQMEGWLREWRAREAARAVAAREAEARQLEAEIEALRQLARSAPPQAGP